MTPVTYLAEEPIPDVQERRTARRMNLADDLAAAAAAADHLAARRAELMDVLTRHESAETAADELDGSIDALRNLHREVQDLRAARAGRVAVFLPVNLPLYSLVLFAAIPSLAAEAVTVRGPAATEQWHKDVLVASGLGEYFTRLELIHCTRRTFIQDHVRRADTVIFTGRYENAEQVRRACPSALFVFEGSAPNPIVVGPRADLDASFDRIVAARLFNGGQDCAGPDAYLVHSSRADAFVARLRTTLAALPCGGYDNPLVRVGPILNPRPLRDLAQRLEAAAGDVVYGGGIDMEAATVQPTVIVRPLSRHDRLDEFFAPVFYILSTTTPPSSTPSSPATSTPRTPCTSRSSARTSRARCTRPPPSSSDRPSSTSNAETTPTAATGPTPITSPAATGSSRSRPSSSAPHSRDTLSRTTAATACQRLGTPSSSRFRLLRVLSMFPTWNTAKV
ncbi:aldehyde dehydrogenase family protein [Streptomyces sp. NPDC046465]|uniref:aldehyde dehydrogenase family protein n=1 Tax=Streptomyces sp. NPDC046465 TaxID=3155810 RepID=UPI0033E263B2